MEKSPGCRARCARSRLTGELLRNNRRRLSEASRPNPEFRQNTSLPNFFVGVAAPLAELSYFKEFKQKKIWGGRLKVLNAEGKV
jgi:hypothetical protein